MMVWLWLGILIGVPIGFMACAFVTMSQEEEKWNEQRRHRQFADSQKAERDRR